MGQNVAPVVVRGETADPAVEELDTLGPGVELGEKIAAHPPRQPIHEVVPRRGLAVHQRLGMEPSLARPPLNAIAREREWSPGKADHWEILIEPGTRRPDAVEDVGQGVEVFELPDPRHIPRRADRIVDHRTLASGELQIEPHRLEDREEIAEDDRRVDPQPVHRREHHLGR